jgi:hypothetical protein
VTVPVDVQRLAHPIAIFHQESGMKDRTYSNTSGILPRNYVPARIVSWLNLTVFPICIDIW